MRKWIVLLVVAAACSRGPSPGASLTGAPTPRQAASEFMNAVKAGDLQAMSVVWGTAEGPARDQLPREELDQRLLTMQGCYRHDRFEVLQENVSPGGQRTVQVQISRGNRTKVANFQMVRGPSNRWYVLDADFGSMQDFCG